MSILRTTLTQQKTAKSTAQKNWLKEETNTSGYVYMLNIKLYKFHSYLASTR